MCFPSPFLSILNFFSQRCTLCAALLNITVTAQTLPAVLAWTRNIDMMAHRLVYMAASSSRMQSSRMTLWLAQPTLVR
jgi:hypothetical protein